MHRSLEADTCSVAGERLRPSGLSCRANHPCPQLVSELHAVLNDRRTTADERLQQAAAILSALQAIHDPAAGGDPVERGAGTAVERGGLAPWQVRCVKEFIEQGLGGRLTGADLARRVKLSEHHFCRAFRVSLRQTPHSYVIGRRVERACDMMRSRTLSIGQIAIECGFADQAHFNKCFRKLFGTSPGSWRRAQAGSKPLVFAEQMARNGNGGLEPHRIGPPARPRQLSQVPVPAPTRECRDV
jgi:AraC-like DNA-binding protein